MADMKKLLDSKPRSKNDEALVAEISRLEPAYTVARDDLVRYLFFFVVG